MFTGIITHLGKITRKTNSLLTIKADCDFLSKITEGTSVSINGICLTAVETGRQDFKVDFTPETYTRTNIKYLQPPERVNLELPATPNTFLSGHIVQGHIDGISKLLDIKISGNSRILKLSAPLSIIRYIVEKGSIAINGISLTIIEADKNFFTVGIIPYTWANTTLHTIKKDSFVNIEVDILAKYVAAGQRNYDSNI